LTVGSLNNAAGVLLGGVAVLVLVALVKRRTSLLSGASIIAPAPGAAAAAAAGVDAGALAAFLAQEGGSTAGIPTSFQGWLST
jgi:hypothetical protein